MHILLVETIFDTLNAKAALFAIDEFFDENPSISPLPVRRSRRAATAAAACSRSRLRATSAR